MVVPADTLFIADRTAQILEANQAACDQLGYTRHELLALRVPDVVAPEYAARALQRMGGTSPAGYLEGVAVTRDGTRMPEVPVVLMRGYGSLLATLPVERGHDSLQKPFRLRELAALLERRLGR